MKIVLTYSELRALLHPVIPHAGTDDMLPVLTSIAVAASGPYVVAQATDRFSAAFKRVRPAKRPSRSFGVLIQRSDAQRMLNLLRPSRGEDPTITLAVTDGKIRVATESNGLALGFVGLDISFLQPILDVGARRFPDLAGLLPAPESFEQATPASGFNLTYLTRFRSAIDVLNVPKSEQVFVVHMGATANKPLIVTVEDDFVGIIMPRRLQPGGSHATADLVPSIVSDWRAMVPRNGVNPPESAPEPVLDQSEPAREAIGATS